MDPVTGALGLVGLRMAAPDVGRTVLAASAGNDVPHAGFTFLSERANSHVQRSQLGD